MASIDNIFGDAPASAGSAPASSPSIDNIFGSAPAAPKAPATPSVDNIFANIAKPLDTSSSKIASNLSPTTPAITAPKPANTSNIGSAFAKTNNFTFPSTNVETSTPDVKGAIASKNLPDATAPLPNNPITAAGNAANDVLIKGPGELLGNTTFMKEASAGIDAGSVAGNFGEQMVQKLSLGLKSLTGLTGGLYQTPTETDIKNPDLLDKGLTVLSQGLGMAVSISSLGAAAGKTAIGSSAADGLTNLVNKYPILSKYIAPYIKPLIENTAGFAAYGQLDPKLGTNLKARGVELLKDIGEAPLFTALGAIRSPALGLPVSFGLGFGMAKLSGASNQDATASGLAFAFLDAAGRAEETRGLTPDDIQAKLANEAVKILQPYSKVKLTADSPIEDLKAAYHSAAHQTHPDVGGTAEAFSKVSNAYDLLTKGAVSKVAPKPTEAEQSVKSLSGDIKKGIEVHGPLATHQALMDNLSLDEATASRLVTATQTPQTPKEQNAAIDAHVQRHLDTEAAAADTRIQEAVASGKAPVQKDIETGYWNAKIAPAIKKGDTVVIDPDEVRKYYGDYKEENRAIYSKANLAMLGRALTEHPGKNFAAVGGGSGSGKTEFLTKSLVKGKYNGVIYDATQSDPNFVMKVIDMAKAANKTPEAYFIISDPSDARYWTLLREAESGRPVHHDFFVKVHSNYPKSILRLAEEGVPVHAIDARGISGEDVANKMANKDFVQDPIDTISKMDYSEANVRARTLYTENYYGTKTTEGNTEEHDGALQESAGSQGDDGKENGDKIQPAGSDKYNRGFVNVEQVAKDAAAAIARVQETIKELENVRELSGDIRDAGYQHENKRVANRQRLINLAKEVGDMLDAQGWNDLYHYDENSDEKITPEQKALYDGVIKPLKDSLSSIITEYKVLGGRMDAELFFMENEGYTPRFAKDKGGPIDKIIDDFKALGAKAKSTLRNGGLLSKSLGTVDKSRKFFYLDYENGSGTVVHVPGDKSQNVLGFTNGKITDLGPVKGSKTPKVNEFFDPAVRTALEKLAKSLGIKHERVATGQSKGLGTGTAGVSFTGKDLIKTRLSPDQVLAHEIGHQIDEKYGLQAVIKDAQGYGAERKKQIQDEMRALADKRFEGGAPNKTFTKYVRSGPEKMAVMFEAYISNRDMFQETAPHLYDDFRDFLASHAELKPFLDIEGSVQLGSTSHGNVQSGKIGKTFVDKNGNRGVIRQATTKEIEAHTKVRYHTNVLANYLVALDRATNALNAMKLLERIKNEDEFGDIIRKDSPDEAPPEGWKSVGDVLPQFRGYHFEQRAAEVLQDLASRQKGQMHIPVIDEINNFLVGAIVFNPVMHVPNVVAGRSTAAAALGVSAKSLANLHTAINEVKNAGPLYLSYLEHGAPFMALKATTKNFTDAILTQYTDEIENEKDPTFLDEHQQLANILGYTNPAALARGLKHLNETATWGSNDVLFMHALMDYQDVHGGTMEESIKAVSKYMADYRIPERVFLPGQAGRFLSYALQSRAFLFGRFHYTGVIKPWLESMKDSAGPGSTGKQRQQGLRALAYLLLMGLVAWPYINKMLQGITGSPTSYDSMPGPLRPIQVGEKLAQQGPAGVPAALNSVFTVSPVLRSMIELGFNVDLFTRNPVYGNLPAEGLSAYGTSVLSPLASASRMNPGDFALSLFGVWTPKNVPAKTTLTTMKYDELPALQTQVKKDITAGNQKKADAEMREFNTRAIVTWNQYELETGGTNLVTTDAEKQAFLKDYGIKEPGVKALTNANTLYGDGSLTAKSSLIANIATYAKAIGVSPDEAFHLIFTGQTIARVSNFGLFDDKSAIIVQRMSLDASEKVKSDKGATAGQVLDHVIPLEAGGSNDVDNLNLIPAANNEGEQHTFENALGAAVKAGKITQAEVREYSIRYKVGQGETLPDQYMKEFTDKYGGKTMTLQEVQDAIAGK